MSSVLSWTSTAFSRAPAVLICNHWGTTAIAFLDRRHAGPSSQQANCLREHSRLSVRLAPPRSLQLLQDDRLYCRLRVLDLLFKMKNRISAVRGSVATRRMFKR